MKKKYYVYIITNQYNTVIYTGVTNNLRRRITEHKLKIASNFTSKYKASKLVYYESYDYINDAIFREKQIKAGSRKKKIQLIETKNKYWIELFAPVEV